MGNSRVMINGEFSERVKEIRKKMDITQIELAAKLNVNPSTIQRWERGVSIPFPVVMKAFEDFCDQYVKKED